MEQSIVLRVQGVTFFVELSWLPGPSAQTPPPLCPEAYPTPPTFEKIVLVPPYHSGTRRIVT